VYSKPERGTWTLTVTEYGAREIWQDTLEPAEISRSQAIGMVTARTKLEFSAAAHGSWIITVTEYGAREIWWDTSARAEISL
jgi:hypothetical protein